MLIYAYDLSNGREIPVGYIKFMNIMTYSRIFRETVHTPVGNLECRRLPKQSPGRMAVAMTSHGEFRVIRNRIPINFFGQGSLHILHESAWSDVRKWCTACWLQRNDTAVHTAIPPSARLNGNPVKKLYAF